MPAGCLVRHGYYSRKLKTQEGTIVLRILRVKCKECGRTHAILPELVVPYTQIPADLQQKMLSYSLGSPELESLMQDNTDITESNVLAVKSRYRQEWKERLATMAMKVQDSILDLIRRAFQSFHRQFMQIHRGINLEAFLIHILPFIQYFNIMFQNFKTKKCKIYHFFTNAAGQEAPTSISWGLARFSGVL